MSQSTKHKPNPQDKDSNSYYKSDRVFPSGKWIICNMNGQFRVRILVKYTDVKLMKNMNIMNDIVDLCWFKPQTLSYKTEYDIYSVIWMLYIDK
jgi:hypothetical protein